MSQSLTIQKAAGNSLTIIRNGANTGGTYTLPVATNAILGGVITGADLAIAANGTLNLANQTSSGSYGDSTHASHIEVDGKGRVIVAQSVLIQPDYSDVQNTPNLTLYLTTAAASSTYATIASLSSYLTTASASSTYQTIAGMSSYLTSAAAASTYATITSLASYVTTANFTWANLSGKPSIPVGSDSTPNAISATGYAGTNAAFSRADHYHALPIASTTVLGGVKVDGTTITISGGVISSSGSYSLPVASASTLGGVKIGSGVSIDANGFITVSTSYAGLGANTFSGTQSLGGNLLVQPKLQSYRETFTTPAISSGTLTLDLSGSNFFKVSLNAAITTLSIINTPSSAAASFTLEFTADGTARTVMWPTAVKWPGGTAPTLTSTSSKTDTFVFYTTDGGTTWKAFVTGQNLS